MTFRNTLRDGTADYHDVVDDLFGRFDMTDPGQYAAFLTSHARALPAAEQALERGGISRIVPDWAERRRSHLLRADLESLGRPMPPPIDLADLSSTDELWGAAYVLEGSKLGGALLAKRVPHHLPCAYLRFQGPKGAMKAFMDRLDAAVPTDQARAIAAAVAIFAAFRSAAKLELGSALP